MDTQNPINRLTAAELYAKRGWYSIPIPRGQKGPAVKGWQNLRLAGAELEAALSDPNGNIGLLLGEPSGGLVDIDLDDAVAIQLAPRFLPETAVKFGRESKPRSHWLFRVSGASKYLKLKSPDGKPIVEVRTTGQQTVVPPSVHPSGEKVRFDEFGEPALVDVAELEAGVRLLAMCVILTGDWPMGSRHEAALAIAGWLLKEGVSADHVRLVIRAAAETAGDEEVEDRVRTVASTEAAMSRGGAVVGASGAKAVFGDGTANALFRALGRTPARHSSTREHAEQPDGACAVPCYHETPEGIWLVHQTEEGVRRIELTNFRARIEREIVTHDVSGTHRVYETLVTLPDHSLRRVWIEAIEFAKMTWVARELGVAAVVAPRRKAEAAVAIQTLSQPVPQTVGAAALGWQTVEGQERYVHTGGAIGPAGLDPTFKADLGLSGGMFELPAPPEGDELARSIRASMRLLDLAPAPIVFPLFAAAWRSLLGVGVDHFVWIFGRTGVYKSELAALVQQHFGLRMTRLELPAAWSSTDNALEELAHLVRDAVLVVDDYKPTGSRPDDRALEAKADRLLRGAGNGAGRSRLSKEMRLQHGRAPEALILVTGEDLPPGTSLRARGLALHLRPGDVSTELLSKCQDHAKQGLFAQAASAFCRWLAPRLAEQQALFRARADALRSEFQSRSHPRLAGILAGLHAALEVWGRFVSDPSIAPALTAEEVDGVLARARVAWAAHLGEAEQAFAKADPADRFLELLQEAFATGRAHVATHAGGPPVDAPGGPAAWGWRARTTPAGDVWEPRGPIIGWMSESDLHLLPGPSWTTVRSQSAGTESFVESQPVVRAELHRRGILVAPGHAKGQGFLDRTRVAGHQQRVVRLDLRRLMDWINQDRD